MVIITIRDDCDTIPYIIVYNKEETRQPHDGDCLVFNLPINLLIDYLY